MSSTLDPGPLVEAVAARVERWRRERFASRLFSRDHTLWSPEPLPELADRLGWLELPEAMAPRVEELERLGAEVAAEGVEAVVLLGMGGSSLAPALYAATFGHAPDRPRLEVLDTTHPDAVAAAEARLDPERTVWVVASKSGTTVETLALFRHFWRRAGGDGRRFLAITDPGTPLEVLARERGFRGTVLAPPDVGGRFSALSVFGLVPAALCGVPVAGLLESASAMAAACRGEEGNPGLELGALLGEAALAGRDKLTLLATPGFRALPAWLEQLLAESTGKGGRGIVPVDGEPRLDPAGLGPDRVLVTLALAGEGPAALPVGHPTVRMALASPVELGGELYRWEVATAAAGAVLGVNPFDQPDVQLAKELARRALGGELEPGEGVPAETPEAVARLERLVAALDPGDYLAVQAFLAPAAATDAALARLRAALRRRTSCPVTVGYGPRFLHSTGQLHKGGPPTVRCLQLVDTPRSDLPVPETGTTFGRLIRAQADGDLAALAARGRQVLRIELGGEPAAAVTALAEALS